MAHPKKKWAHSQFVKYKWQWIYPHMVNSNINLGDANQVKPLFLLIKLEDLNMVIFNAGKSAVRWGILKNCHSEGCKLATFSEKP